MDFAALILFLSLYYLRPQEWFPAFGLIHPIQILSVMAIWAMAQKENYKKLCRTPLDWLIVCYFVWTLIAGFQPRLTFTGIQSVILFYFLAVCSLNTIPRLKKFLGCWCVLIFVIAALAVLSEYGIDPFGSHDVTEGQMKGRLILNLSIFDNPNTLAHTIVPAIPLFYYLFYWRQITMKVVVLLLAVPLYCIYLTQSKGAFICGFATLLATLTFGRSRIWQIIILLVAIGFGYGALYALPRMNELNKSKADPAIQGRIAALSYGLTLMQSNFFGIGLGNFQEAFLKHGPLEKFVTLRIIPMHRVPTQDGQFHEVHAMRVPIVTLKHFNKATHGAYNQNGAELGYVGLFLFVSILYCCVRTLLLVKSEDNDQERIRRSLFAMVVAYAASSWMVDFTYRPTFFMMVAAVSAFHRHLLRKHEEAGKIVEPAPFVPDRPWIRRLPPIRMPGIPLPGLATMGPSSLASSPLQPVAMDAGSLASSSLLPTAMTPAAGGSNRALAWHKPASSLENTLRKKFKWTRLGFADYAIMVVLTYATIRYWEHLIVTM